MFVRRTAVWAFALLNASNYAALRNWFQRVIVRWVDRAQLTGNLNYESTGVHALRLR
ncbi:MAG: hypothetical protein LC641_12395 [Spirochaeta sp.]|nr:hypothetical protein [Spirochaeta sp.]